MDIILRYDCICIGVGWTLYGGFTAYVEGWGGHYIIWMFDCTC